MKIAIIGSGIAGLYAAKLLEEKGHEVSIYEKSSRIGGRIQTVEISFRDTTYYQDWGAEYFIDRNTAIADLVQELGLDTKEYLSRRSIYSPKTGGHLVLPSSKDSGFSRIKRMVQLLLTYRRDALTLNALTKQFTHEINEMYQILDNHPIDHALALIKEKYQLYMEQTLFSLFQDAGLSQQTIENFVNPLFRPVYMLDGSKINAFLGALAFAAKGSTIFHVSGGNTKLVDALRSRLKSAKIHLNSEVTRVSEIDNKISLTLQKGSSYQTLSSDYDFCFVSGPLTSIGNIEFETEEEFNLPNIPEYHEAYHTIVHAVPVDSMMELIDKEVDTIFVSGNTADIWEINIIDRFVDGILCDITSTKPLDDCDLTNLLASQPDIIMQKHWKPAYPKYTPETILSMPTSFAPHSQIYFGSDTTITSMDSSIRIAEHVVSKIVNKNSLMEYEINKLST